MGNVYIRNLCILAAVFFFLLFISSLNVISSSDFSDIKEAKRLIIEAKKAYPEISDISTSLVLGFIEVESEFKASAIGGVGEIGFMQVRPTTYDWIMSEYDIEQNGEMSDSFNNIVAGMHYISWLKKRLKGKTFKTIQAYNVGLQGFRDGRTSTIYALRVYTGSFKYILVW